MGPKGKGRGLTDRWTAIGSSHEPGTDCSTILDSFTPQARSFALVPATNGSMTAWFHRAWTIPTLKELPSWCSGAGALRDIVWFGVGERVGGARVLVKGGLLEGELSFCCLVEHLWSMEGLFQLTKKSGKHRRRDCGAAELFSCVPWFKGGLAESHREE